MINSMVELTKSYVIESIQSEFSNYDRSYKTKVDVLIPEWVRKETA